jgi:hypothetical protein
VTAPNANPRLADAAWLRRRYGAGVPVADIAAEAGCDPSRVWVALRRHGIELRGRADGIDVRPLTKADIKRAYRAAALAGDTPVSTSSPLGNRAAAARHLGVSDAKLRDAEVRVGLRSPDRAAEAATLSAQGLTIAQVAAEIGTSYRTAQRLLVGPSVVKRPRGRPAG